LLCKVKIRKEIIRSVAALPAGPKFYLCQSLIMTVKESDWFILKQMDQRFRDVTWRLITIWLSILIISLLFFL